MNNEAKQLKAFNPWEFNGTPLNYIPSSDLELNRNARAVRLPRNEVSKLIAHKEFRSLVVFLRLKPLYISGYIHADCGRIPYKKIAAFCGLSESGTRAKLNRLKALGLAKVDHNRNIILGSWKTFCEVLGSGNPHSYKHKYRFMNNQDINLVTLCRSVAYCEARQKQIYRFTTKETINQVKLSLFDLNKSKDAKHSEQLARIEEKLQNPRYVKRIQGKMKKRIARDWNQIIQDREAQFYSESETRLKATIEENEYLRTHNLGENIRYTWTYPGINPHFTLSCKGLARLMNRKSQGSGYYIQKQMQLAGMLEIYNHYIDTDNQATNFEALAYNRPEVFRKKRPPRSRSGKAWMQPFEPKKPFRIIFPNLLEPNLILKNC